MQSKYGKTFDVKRNESGDISLLWDAMARSAVFSPENARALGEALIKAATPKTTRYRDRRGNEWEPRADGQLVAVVAKELHVHVGSSHSSKEYLESTRGPLVVVSGEVDTVAQRYRDCDGDIWELRPGGSFTAVQSTTDGYVGTELDSVEGLRQEFGPLTPLPVGSLVVAQSISDEASPALAAVAESLKDFAEAAQRLAQKMGER